MVRVTIIYTCGEPSVMTELPDEPTPPEGLPNDIAGELRRLTAEELRNVIIHAQELLHTHEENPSSIEVGPNEDILRSTEHEGYTEVVKQVTCADGCDDCPHGPYVYHVTDESRPEGGTHKHWSFVGSVSADDE